MAQQAGNGVQFATHLPPIQIESLELVSDQSWLVLFSNTLRTRMQSAGGYQSNF